MLKYHVASRVFYRENPNTAGHPVMGTQINMLAVEDDGPYLIGDSPVRWDEANKQNVQFPLGFEHYEKRRFSEKEATQIIEGKISKLIVDGFVFESVPNIRHFIDTGEWIIDVIQHPATPQRALNPCCD